MILIRDLEILKCRASASIAAAFALPSRGGNLVKISKWVESISLILSIFELDFTLTKIFIFSATFPRLTRCVKNKKLPDVN